MLLLILIVVGFAVWYFVIRDADGSEVVETIGSIVIAAAGMSDRR